MKTSDFDYELPIEYIAQTPIEPRDASRLLVLNRKSGEIEHTVFRELGRFLDAGDLLVLNQTRVIPARLYARKLPGGGRIELLLLKRLDVGNWEVLIGGKGMTVGRQFIIVPNTPGGIESTENNAIQGEITAVLYGPRRVVRFDRPVESKLVDLGHMPLPPYIHTALKDPERYQTVYSQDLGSAAAPTAGLHFTPELINALREKGVHFARVTLHVGLDTFAPVNEDRPENHHIHTEWCQLSEEDALLINHAVRQGKRVVAVGTTSVRTIETAAMFWRHNQGGKNASEGPVQAYEGPTDLYILPGFTFQVVNTLLTNFHLPRSTLIMLVSAFAGRENVLVAYETAKKERYRFYSFGDAMLIYTPKGA
jgi:S-adenosylmethionine:tRNA ribosyltransferase-isomerase